MSDPVVEVFRLGVGLLRWPRPDWMKRLLCFERSDKSTLHFDWRRDLEFPSKTRKRLGLLHLVKRAK